jgi:hypothetical protein
MLRMSSQTPPYNQIGMPPPGRTIHRRRAQLEAEAAERGEGPIDSRRQLVVSMITFGVVLAIGLLLAWVVL